MSRFPNRNCGIKLLKLEKIPFRKKMKKVQKSFAKLHRACLEEVTNLGYAQQIKNINGEKKYFSQEKFFKEIFRYVCLSDRRSS